MPKGKGFASKAQWRKCFAMQHQSKAGSWDCQKWAHENQDAGRSFRSLPSKKGSKGAKKS